MIRFKDIQGSNKPLLYRIHTTKDAIAEVFLAHGFPQMLYRIELRTVGREKDEVDVARYRQFPSSRFVSRGPIQNETEQFFWMSCGKLFEKTLMHGSMHARENERVHRPIERTQRCERVRVLSDRLLGNIRPHMFGCPAICRTGDASEPRLVFKENPECESFERRFQLCSLEDEGEKTL